MVAEEASEPPQRVRTVLQRSDVGGGGFPFSSGLSSSSFQFAHFFYLFFGDALVLPLSSFDWSGIGQHVIGLTKRPKKYQLYVKTMMKFRIFEALLIANG